MRRRKLGFTLLEILLVVSMMAIVAAIAVPMIVGNLDSAETRSDEVIFEDIVHNTNTGILQLNTSGRAINITAVINETLAPYVGKYNADGTYVLGSCPYAILPQEKRTGKCVTIQLVRKMGADGYAGSGFVVRFYKDSDAEDPSKDVPMKKNNGDTYTILTIVPGVHFTTTIHGAVEITDADLK